MNKKLLLLVLLVAGVGLGYMIYQNYNQECCKKSEVVTTTTEKIEDVKKPGEIVGEKVKETTTTEVKSEEKLEENPDKTKKVKKISKCKTVKSNKK